jgi:putative two-component system response regulator
MPDLTMEDLLVKARVTHPNTPAVILASISNIKECMEAVNYGAFDLAVVKPSFNEGYFLRIIENAIAESKHEEEKEHGKKLAAEEARKAVLDQLEKISSAWHSTHEMVQRLLVAAEFRDDETGNHVKRIGMYAAALSSALNLDIAFRDTIAVASTMHDIGKIGIPDNVLLKPSFLSQQEFETMKKHTTIGYKILSGSSNEYLKMASSIALGHHERWDGSGYPQGLRGEAIPIENRIVIMCDQYDALRSRRPYKAPYDHATTFKILTEGDNRTRPEHFDPAVMNAFARVAPVFENIFTSFAVNKDLSA